MKLSTIAVVLVVALSLATLAVPAGAFFGPFGGCGFGIPFGGCGVGTNFASSFQSSTSFSTYGTTGFGLGGCGFGVPLGLGFGGCGIGLGGFGLGGCGLGGFASPFGFC